MWGEQGIEVLGIDGAFGGLDVERRADARDQPGRGDVRIGLANSGLD